VDVFSDVLDMFRKEEQLEMRTVSEALARVVPRSFKEREFICGEEIKEETGFMALITTPKRLTITDIDGSEEHLR